MGIFQKIVGQAGLEPDRPDELSREQRIQRYMVMAAKKQPTGAQTAKPIRMRLQHLIKHRLERQNFGRLTVIREADVPEGLRDRARYWLCQCKCGNQKVVAQASLLRNLAKSCGCAKNEALGNRSRKHGRSTSPEYKVWIAMRRRDAAIVDQRWMTSFQKFFADVGARPSKKHILARLDHSKGFGPGNAAWATRSELMKRLWNVGIRHLTPAMAA